MANMSKVGRVATKVYAEAGSTVIQYHATKVVTFNDKEILLNNGGWKTNTTKARMNQASNEYGLGYTVYQKDFGWFVTYKGETLEFDGNVCLFDR